MGIGVAVKKYFGRGKEFQRQDAAPEDSTDLLDGLPAGFFLLNDLRGGGGSIDHILVGPKGIFVLKIQSHSGTVTVLAEQIFRNGRSLDSDKELIRDARTECRTLEELLARRGITELKPQPLIVFMNGIIGVHGTIKGLEVMHRNTLPDFMKRRKDVMSAREAEGILEFLKIGRAQSPL